LSKIVERATKLRVAIAPSGGLSIPAQGSTSEKPRSSTSNSVCRFTIDLPYREEDGGADRDRTDDILLAKQALSQLSYSPIVNQYNLIGRDKGGGPG
jgi:hypothetical protein